MSAVASTKLGLPERYEVLRHIADGGMASVWCARDAVLGRRVAIKVLAERFEHDDFARERFQREARTAAQLSGHRNVVTIFDVGEADGRAFIVMELLPCGTVAQALSRGPVAREEAIRWVREAAAALDHAHRCGVVHRDIKPGNFLLDTDRVLHIADFGIARAAAEDPITSSGQLFGTSAYLAPEQIRGGPATPASDRYALAVTAFELLTGERPFTAEGFTAQAQQHLSQPPPDASTRDPALPRAVDPVLARGLAKSPGERWPTASELAIALEGALSARGSWRMYKTPPLVFARPTRSRPAAGSGSASKDPATAGRVNAARRRRGAALVALGSAALAAVAIAAGAGHHARPMTGSAAAGRSAAAAPSNKAAAAPAARPSSSGATTSASTQSAAGNAAALEARGHQLMLDGSYGQAISILRQAIAGASPTSLTFAYALYDLGHSLRLSGDARAAIPVLERRLQIPNQSGVVSEELAIAEQQAGASPSASGGPAPSGSGGATPQSAGAQPFDYRPYDGKHHGRGRHGGDQQTD